MLGRPFEKLLNFFQLVEDRVGFATRSEHSVFFIESYLQFRLNNLSVQLTQCNFRRVFEGMQKRFNIESA